MQAIKVKENVYWVGGVDWNLRNFHGYLTPRGSTYNAYLIIDEKVTLIDTVKHYLYDEMLERISSVIDPKKIEVVISNHVEMDHSGGMPRLMDLIPNATVIASPQGVKGLKEHYGKDWKFHTCKTGDTFSIGKRTLSFLQTPMVHWPDNMLTYSGFDRILFSNDSFGQHIASTERFDDELSLGIAIEEAQKYYGNIVLCYNNIVQKELAAASAFSIEMIAPSHGIIWRSHVSEVVNHYKKWAYNETDKLALVIYDSMWGSTAKMAYCIADGFEKAGVAAKLFNLSNTHISDIMTDVVRARYVCVGSPTMNSNMLPTVAGFLTYLRALSPKQRIGMAFGSYGWGGQSIEHVEEGLKHCGFELLESAKAKYIPSSEVLAQLKEKVQVMISASEERVEK